jgi:hypothetical protein
LDHHLLRQENLLGRDLHPQVPARDHDRVRLFENGIKVLQALLVLHLRDDLDPCSLRAQNLADEVEVGALAHERGRDKVDVVGDAPVAEVALVLLGEGGEVDDDSGEVDIFALERKRKGGSGERERVILSESARERVERNGGENVKGENNFPPRRASRC